MRNGVLPIYFLDPFRNIWWQQHPNPLGDSWCHLAPCGLTQRPLYAKDPDQQVAFDALISLLSYFVCFFCKAAVLDAAAALRKDLTATGIRAICSVLTWKVNESEINSAMLCVCASIPCTLGACRWSIKCGPKETSNPRPPFETPWLAFVYISRGGMKPGAKYFEWVGFLKSLCRCLTPTLPNGSRIQKY